ncbi:hypothetical protein Bbelb_320580 [Branchiostoma belcheri]|nr:hypothetical protein Bbelb_320580 [Branchiostoma belcheri]
MGRKLRHFLIFLLIILKEPNPPRASFLTRIPQNLRLNPGVVGRNKAVSVLASGHDQAEQGQSETITEANTNTTATVLACGDDHQYEDIDNPRVKTGQGQCHIITESSTTTIATVMASGDDHQYEDIDNPRNKTGQGQSYVITESSTNTKASSMTNDQTGQGQSQDDTESLDARNISYGTGPTAPKLNSLYKEATVKTSGYDQTGQSQANTESLDARNISYGTGPTVPELNSLYNEATVKTSGYDQTGQGQSQDNTESLDARNFSYGTGPTAPELNSLYKEATYRASLRPIITKSNTNTTATVMTSGDDQIVQGQSHPNTNTTATVMTRADSEIKDNNAYDDLDSNVHQYANKDDINEELRWTGTQRKEPTNIGGNNTHPHNVNLVYNAMYVSSRSRKRENKDRTNAATISGIPNATSRRSYRLPWATAVMFALVIGVGVGLVSYYTTVEETQPYSHTSPPVRHGTSSRPVSPVPVTSIGSTMENQNDTISSALALATMTTTLPEITTTMPKVTTILPEVTTTLPEVTTTLSEVTTTLFEVTTTLPLVTTTLPLVTTTLPVVTTTMPKVTTTMPKVTTTLSEVTTTTRKVFPHKAERTGFDQVQETTEPQPSTLEGGSYHSLGCWKDSSHNNRAIPTLEGLESRLGDMHSYQARSDAIEKCFQAAKSRSFTVFAVQHGGQCFGSANGHNTYFKFGRSTACEADGKGGTWANEVYRITTQTGM